MNNNIFATGLGIINYGEYNCRELDRVIITKQT